MFRSTPLDLTDGSALVTGGGQGLGKEMARLLASPAGSYITGAVLAVEGGAIARMW